MAMQILPGHIVWYVVNEQPLDPTGGDGKRVEVGDLKLVKIDGEVITL